MDAQLSFTRLMNLKTKPWNNKEFSIPAELFSVPGMLSTEEKRMLHYLALEDYKGSGVIADLGSCLGGSTICFATGLAKRGFNKPVIYAYDLFKLGHYEKQRFFPENPPEDLRTRDVFDNNLKDFQHLINTFEGDILNFTATDPIEYLFIDIAKSYKVMDHLLLNFFPALITKKSLVILQDYLWGSTGPWHHIVMEKLEDYCEYVTDTTTNSVVFFLNKEIPLEVLKNCQWMSIPFNEKVRLMDKAIEKQDTEQKKQYLKDNKELLMQGKDTTWGMHYHGL